MKKTLLRVGDMVKHNKKKYVVSGSKGWVHKHGWVSLVREIGTTPLLTRVEECSLIKRRERVGKKWWLIFSKGEK